MLAAASVGVQPGLTAVFFHSKLLSHCQEFLCFLCVSFQAESIFVTKFFDNSLISLDVVSCYTLFSIIRFRQTLPQAVLGIPFAHAIHTHSCLDNCSLSHFANSRWCEHPYASLSLLNSFLLLMRTFPLGCLFFSC